MPVLLTSQNIIDFGNEFDLVNASTVGLYMPIESTQVNNNNPASTKHLYNICAMSAQRLRRWADIVQILYKCFLFTRKTKKQPSAYR